MNKKKIFFIFLVFCFLIFNCENQWMIDILPEKNGEEPVTFTINLNTTGLVDNSFDAVSFSGNFNNTGNTIGNAVSGEDIAIYYKLKGSHKNNEIEIIFGTGEGTQTKIYTTEKNEDIIGNTPHYYTVDPKDAVDGIINIRVYSRHSDLEFLLEPTDIIFTKDGSITFIPGANNEDAGCTYTYRFYKGDDNVDSTGANRQMLTAPVPVQNDPNGRLKYSNPLLTEEMLNLGEGRYFVRIMAHTNNEKYDTDSIQSEISTSVYVYELKVEFEFNEASEEVTVDTDDEINNLSSYDDDFALNIFSDTNIILTANANLANNRIAIWSLKDLNSKNTYDINDNICSFTDLEENAQLVVTFVKGDRLSQTTPSITDGNITKTWGDSSFNLTATGGESSGGYAFIIKNQEGNNGVISIEADIVTITGAGTAQVTVIKRGDEDYKDSEESAPIAITVNKRPLNSSGIAVSVASNSECVYTGNPITLAKSEINVTDSSAVITNDDWQIKSDGYSNNTNAGTATVTIEATTSGNYTAPLNSATFTINKAAGASLTGSITADTITYYSIKINAVTAPANNQTVEYNISKNSNGTGLGTWQDSLTFYSLDFDTNYYVYARSKENSNYLAGTAIVSSIIKTEIRPSFNIVIELGNTDAGTWEEGAPVTPDGKLIVNLEEDITIGLGTIFGIYENIDWKLNGISIGSTQEITFNLIDEGYDEHDKGIAVPLSVLFRIDNIPYNLSLMILIAE